MFSFLGSVVFELEGSKKWVRLKKKYSNNEFVMMLGFLIFKIIKSNYHVISSTNL